MSFPIILRNTENNDIGWYFCGSVSSPVLQTEITLANFNLSGTTPVLKDKLLI